MGHVPTFYYLQIKLHFAFENVLPKQCLILYQIIIIFDLKKV